MAQEFLERKGIDPVIVTDARKDKIGAEDAWSKLKKAGVIYVGRGKSFASRQPTAASRDEIMKEALGRSGTLRAPTLQTGEVILIGYNSDMYDQVLG